MAPESTGWVEGGMGRWWEDARFVPRICQRSGPNGTWRPPLTDRGGDLSSVRIRTGCNLQEKLSELETRRRSLARLLIYIPLPMYVRTGAQARTPSTVQRASPQSPHPRKSNSFFTNRPYAPCAVALAVSTTWSPSGGTLVMGAVIAAVKLSSADPFPVTVGIAT